MSADIFELSPAQRDAYRLLPRGIASPEQLSATSEWFFQLDTERMIAEAAMLPNTEIGARVAQAVAPAATIEDRTDYYVTFPLATKAIREDPARVEFLDTQWVPLEFTHGLVDHMVADVSQGRRESARAERNAAAVRRVTITKHVTDIFVKQAVARFAPESMAAFVDAKGMANEKNPEFLYARFSTICRQLGFKTLAEAFGIMSKEEKFHGGIYRLNLKEALEDPSRRRSVRWLMRRHSRVVGHELLAPDERVLFAEFFDPNDREQAKFVADADKRFSALPGMKGITPLFSSFAVYRPELSARAA